MADITTEETRTQSMEDTSYGRRIEAREALVEWRSSNQVENGTPSTSPPYWDTDDDDDDDGLKPSKLYGRHTWKIDKFSEINKRELRSSAFEVGNYKWYILIYPQGCDVCNHLSLFLCVANHDKLLPGWSHFAQFTIAVVNKDPKKSKYSDTLHRFWKKEHDWGWKKFIELPKLQDGFIDDSDCLTIKAQVQVIRERVDRPFRCLDCHYRRELVRVYLTNVEQICRRFMEERRNKLGRLIQDKARWSSFCAFWLEMDPNSRRRMSREKMDVILKVVVKNFFIEKEVTSTLVMDSLYSGLRALESQDKRKGRLSDSEILPDPIVCVDTDMFVLADDVLPLLERVIDPLPPRDDKGPPNRSKDGNNAAEDLNKELMQRDERRLTDLGRRTVEIMALSHIFSNKIEVSYQEAVALKRQEELIREEEEAWRAESEQKAKRMADKEKKSKKKQAKQKRNRNKGKEKKKEEKAISLTYEKESEDKDCVTEKAQSTLEKSDTLGDVSDISDSVDGSAEILQPDSEDRESSPVHWDRDTYRGLESSASLSNGVAETKNQTVLDDSSSTCSNESIQSGVANGSHKANIVDTRSQMSTYKGKSQQGKEISDACGFAGKAEVQLLKHATEPKDPNYVSLGGKVCESEEGMAVSSIREPQKDCNAHQTKQNSWNSVDMDRPKEDSSAVLSSPRTTPRNPTSIILTKPVKKSGLAAETVPARKVPSNGPPSSVQPSYSQSKPVGPRAEPQKTIVHKPVEKPMAPVQPSPSISKSSSAPVIPPKVQAAPSGFPVAPTATASLSRSVSATGRLGLDPSPKTQTFIPQSYKHAIVGNTGGSSSFNRSSPPATGVNPVPPVSQSLAPPLPPSSYQPGFRFSRGSQDGLAGGLWAGGSSSSQREATNGTNRYTSMTSRFIEHMPQSLVTDEFPHLDIINDLLDDEHGSNGSMFHVPQPYHSQYMHHGSDLGLSGDLFSCRSSRNYREEGYNQSYGHYEPLGEYMHHGYAQTMYGNGQMDGGLPPVQWQMASMDPRLMAMRNPDDSVYPYYGLESSNGRLSANINGGYREFRPSNGH